MALSLIGDSLPAFADASDVNGDYAQGVQAYREGSYEQARKVFSQLHQKQPENTRTTYYLAITEAQMGQFTQARRLYQEILTLDPNSDAARLAQEGLQFLPDETSALDRPPKFQTASPAGPQPAMAATTPNQPTQTTTSPQAGQATPTPQDMMMMQMMSQLGGGNNNNNGAFNPWAFMAMPPAGSTDAGGNPMSNIDPSAMSSMMMNQMLQNFSLDGDKDHDR